VITMMDYIRRFQVTGRRSLSNFLSGGPDEPARRRSLRLAAQVEFLERRELLATTQTFDGGGTAYTLQQVGLPPAATIVPNGPTGNYLQLTSATATVSQNNSISFVTSDPGTFNQATADFDFRISPGAGGTRGNGLGFALLNTGNFGTSGPAASVLPEEALFAGSLGVGFSTSVTGAAATDNAVVVSFDAAPVQSINIPKSTLDLAGNVWIHARISVDFVGASVSVVLTPTGGSPLTVVSGLSVPGLGPYQSRVNFGARAVGATPGVTNLASTDLDNVNVQYIGVRQAGRVAFGSSNYVVNENAGVASIDIVRSGGSAGAVTLGFVSADGTAKNGLNYLAVAGTVTFAEGEVVKTINIPIIDDGVYDGDKTVNLYLSNPTLQAPLGTPIAATLTIVNTDPNLPPPTVSPRVRLVYAPHSRRVTAFRLTFSTPMAAASAQNIQNYTVVTPANRYQPNRTVSIAQAVLDPTGTVVTLYRLASDRTHPAKSVRIIVRGSPLTGLTNTAGTFLAGVNGQAGTDAELTVKI
jgi:hypothetical protein